ncbi:MAG: tetratricopeptide repeat protein [Nitrospina sp.]|jgi:tetratricopeptide (TPR) repeat protein|nr:tetratricopeptide repeat protein [Nitrospina sp.]
MTTNTESNKTAEQWFQEALTASKLGDPRTCLESYKKAIEVDPDHFLAHFNLGIRYGKLPMNIEAASHFREALRLKPESPMVHYSLAIVCNLIGETDDAFHHYNEAIRLNPEFAKAHSNLAMLSYSLKRGKDTIHHLLKAIEMFEKNGDAFMSDNAKSLLKDCLKEFNLTAEECQTL